MGSGLRVRLPQLTDLETIVLDSGNVAIERPRGGAFEHLAIEREKRAMARARELVAGSLKMVSATEVRALGAEGDNLVIGLFDDPCGFFLGDEFPPIEAAVLEVHFDGGAWSQLADIAGIDPPGLFAGARRYEEIQKSRDRQRKPD
jgi:hypothetical protein